MNKKFLLWVVLCGAIWGAGLARALALEVPARLFFSWPGTLALALAGSLLAYTVAHVKKSPVHHWLPLALPLLDLTSGDYIPWRGPALLAGGLLLTLLWTFRHRISQRAAPWLVAAAALSLYLVTLSPYVGRADTFEFQVTALRLGIAHPTGYPLYVLLGKLFTLLPFGTLAWQVNLTAALSSAGAMGLVYLLIHRLTQRPGIAALSTLALACSAVVWSQAIIAEVYALNLLFVAGALWLMLDILDARHIPRTLWRAALLMGVSLTNHITMVMLFPAFGLACLLRWPKVRLNDWAKAGGLFALGLLLYAYIPLRWPALHDGQWMSLGEFLAYITGRQFGGALQLGLLRDPTRYSILLRLLQTPFGTIGLLLAAVGLLWLVIRRWQIALLTLAAFLPYCFYGLVYLVPDLEVFIIPAHVLLALWIGTGMVALTAGLHRLRPWAPRLALVMFALLPLSLVWQNLPQQTLRAVGQADEAWGRYALAQPLAENAAILADSEKYPPLYYLQQAEGLRPDLELVMRFDEAGYFEELHTRLSAGQHVYLARYLPGMDAYGVQSVGPLVEVAPPVPPSFMGESVAVFGDALALLTQRLEADPEGRRMHHLLLDWQPIRPLAQDLSLRLRLVTTDGTIVWNSGEQRPVGGYSTTQAWQAGQRIGDYIALAWPDCLPGGDYRLELAVGPRFSADLLAPDWVTLAALTLPWKIAPEPPATSRMLFGDALWVVGDDLPGEVAAESTLVFTLTGLRAGELPAGVRPQFYWMPLDNARWEPPILPEALPANAWPEDLRVQQRYTILAPWLPGQYRLWVSWIVSGEVLPAQCGWLARMDTQCVLADITVGPSTAGLANFGGQILLVDATLDVATPAPGAMLPLTLRWRALRTLTADYTVFAQIIGPEGKRYAQVDSWPVHGTHPTGSWRSGQEINDPYQLLLPSDAPPGEYRVIAGWYLLGTMERLAVLDASGQAMGDYYTVGRFTVGE